MSELDQNQKWKALFRGQVLSATVNKFSVIIRLLDQKAQVMIFLNSIIVPVCLNSLENPALQSAAVISIVTAVLSILAAMICIYPKRRYRKSGDREINLLHFNDIGHLEHDDFMKRFKQVLNDPAKLAETAVHDIYDTSRFSIMPKYMWLKISYAIFAFGNIGAIIVAITSV